MDSRRDRLAAQKVQVALVFQKMLGAEEARAYLIENNFAESNIERILNGDVAHKRAAPVRSRRSLTLRNKVAVPSGPLVTVEEQLRDNRRRVANECD
jgi:hypothetical protein